MPRCRIVVGATVMAVSAVLGAGAGTAQGAVPGRSAPAPRIVARPDHVAAGATTSLSGTHFSPSSAVTLKECAHSMWVVTANPCGHAKSITVQTNAHGAFTTTFTVHRCGAGAKAGSPQTCYIGEPTPSGIDTITLQGAVAVAVSRP
jgi:hypothetical protein